MKVKVVQPVQVIHAGKRHTLGDTVDVDDTTGQEWLRQGWAAETKPPAKAAPRKRASR